MVGDGGRWREMAGDGGRWREMAGDAHTLRTSRLDGWRDMRARRTCRPRTDERRSWRTREGRDGGDGEGHGGPEKGEMAGRRGRWGA